MPFVIGTVSPGGTANSIFPSYRSIQERCQRFIPGAEAAYLSSTSRVPNEQMIIATPYDQPMHQIQHNRHIRPVFQGAVGALDGTLISVVVPLDQQVPYRGRGKGECYQNVLGPPPPPPAHIRELEEEVNLLKNLSHPNIFRYLGTAREEDSLNILLEFVPGGSISSLLGKFGSFPEFIMKLASMLYEAVVVGVGITSQERDNAQGHQGGANILVDSKGCVKLADFGASKKVVELEIATGAQSESKWKQLGELAMATGMLEMAEACLKNAMDLSGLLLLYSSLGNAEGIVELASLAKENGKNNVAFLCLFMLGKVSEIVAIWRKDLNKVNPKAAESLADPEEYPNLFEDRQVALAVESEVAETRGLYPPAAEYVNYADRPHVNLVEAFRKLQVDEDAPLENGDLNHEATMTGTKSMKGTPYLMAPDVILQTGHSFSADIWSVGCIVIEMATGKPPWSQQYQEVAALFHIWTTKSQPPIPDHFSVGAKDFLLQYLQKDPNFRAAAAVLLQGEYQETDPVSCVIENSGKRWQHLRRRSLRPQTEGFLSLKQFG
ncbi:hypothetical protein Vadar_032284 [Vaccinium darrowii]|uniref:Uncharacterized protein n=1 Tax=Vaccinium darrowii TaxID=229202 RepID=A0ACB7YQZ1_9ERIC|nr:hypothetical protein Vadar_032284 [Vaccinium darrowii]